MVKSTERTSEREVKEDWQVLIAELQRDIGASQERLADGKKLSLYAAPDGVLKRGIYKFVKTKLKAGQCRLLEDVLDKLRTAPLRKPTKGGKKSTSSKQIRHRRISFEENPFHCALREVPSTIRKFRGDDLTRIGRQLLYASRHDIEPDLLIGFLAQSGTMKKVAENIVAVSEVEEAWYSAKEEAAKLAAAKKSRYPLAILTITATSNERDSCPLEVGFAKARGREAPISQTSMMIKPDPSWDINKKWSRERERATGIRIADLGDSEAAVDVVRRLAELSVGLPVVHCENVGGVSHWLDMLIGAAGEPTDFQLRDVGDFLDHNANKRADLRRRFVPPPPSPGSAGVEAQRLCDAVRMVAKH